MEESKSADEVCKETDSHPCDLGGIRENNIAKTVLQWYTTS
jgi:hypothetical protein